MVEGNGSYVSTDSEVEIQGRSVQWNMEIEYGNSTLGLKFKYSQGHKCAFTHPHTSSIHTQAHILMYGGPEGSLPFHSNTSSTQWNFHSGISILQWNFCYRPEISANTGSLSNSGMWLIHTNTLCIPIVGCCIQVHSPQKNSNRNLSN